MVSAVTTSHVSRKQGFAQRLSARSLARQYEVGNDVSTLGMFDQGFYNKVGYGSGPYETLIQFDPSSIMVNTRARPPKRLTEDDYLQVHQALLNRKKYHGAADLFPPESMSFELRFTDKLFGLGYFDGPNNSLCHFI